MDTTFLTTLLASCLALFGLTIAKDGKVSEFRQEWIDGLREDVSEYLANVHQLYGVSRVPNVFPGNAGVEALRKVNELSSRIRLRLDPEKALSARLSGDMAALREVVSSNRYDVVGLADVEKAALTVERTTSELVEQGWKRVKKGELRFRVGLWASILGILFSLGMISTPYYHRAPSASIAAKTPLSGSSPSKY